MTTALTKHEPRGLTPATVGEAEKMAVMLSKSLLVPEAFRGKPADCFMAISYGLELGMTPVVALTSIAVIKGKPTLYAQSMVALVLRSGVCEYFRRVSSDSHHATYETKRKGDPEATRQTFDEAMAKAAGLSGGNWARYPQQMMEARAKAFLAKSVYPDILAGLMSAEEVQDLPTESSHLDAYVAPPAAEDTAVDAEVVETFDPMAAILECETMEALDALLPALKEMPAGEGRDKARELYMEHRGNLQGAA